MCHIPSCCPFDIRFLLSANRVCCRTYPGQTGAGYQRAAYYMHVLILLRGASRPCVVWGATVLSLREQTDIPTGGVAPILRIMCLRVIPR